LEEAKRTFDLWKQHGGEIIEFSADDARRYREQVTSVLPPILAANQRMKEDYDILVEAGKKQRR
jgi:hypothetical protein